MHGGETKSGTVNLICVEPITSSACTTPELKSTTLLEEKPEP